MRCGKLIAFFCFMLFLFLERASGSVDLPRIWFAQAGKWVDAPPDGQPHSTTVGTIIYLRYDGSFGMIIGTIYKSKVGRSISQGDPMAVYAGTWEKIDSELKLRFRLLYKTIKLPNEAVPGPYVDEIAQIVAIRKIPVLLLLSKKFVPDKELSPQEVEQILASSKSLSERE